MVTHACNLRCDYCYTGTKFRRAMSPEIGRVAIDRAIRSIQPQGSLELSFFGGEPLLEADLISRLMKYARQRAATADIELRPGLTTNATVDSESAQRLMMLDELDLCISCDGLPETHDRHRRDALGRGTSDRVLAAISRLHDAGREIRVMMVVRPDTVASLPEGIAWLRQRHIRQIDLSLDVWATWTSSDLIPLEAALVRTSELWRQGLPEHAINWFDEKAARLTRIPASATARCGFGDGEIAVAPSGRLYPCERLIGEDAPDHPMRLVGKALEGEDFCGRPAPARSAPACAECAVAGQCNTTCRCNNYIRTGDVRRPDALLCLLDKVCLHETARELEKESSKPLHNQLPSR